MGKIEVDAEEYLNLLVLRKLVDAAQNLIINSNPSPELIYEIIGLKTRAEAEIPIPIRGDELELI